MSEKIDYSAFRENKGLITAKFMTLGFMIAVIINLPFYALITERYWPWTDNFLFVLANNGLASFITFFHEIGHTVTAWFYGIPTIPMFDFRYGGGWSWYLSDQLAPLVIMAWAAFACAYYHLKDFIFLRRMIAGLLIINMATAFTDWHQAIITFMGPAFEPIIGGFFLFRAIFDLAPRGSVERLLNAIFGFALPLHSMIEAFALLHMDSARESYFNQKGGHGIGDFDQIAGQWTSLGFDGIVTLWTGLSVAALIIPFALKIFLPDPEQSFE